MNVSEVDGAEVGLGAGLLLAALLACGGANEDQLRTRSAFDFNCPPSEVTITELDASTRGVTACGRRATYVEVCDAPINNAYRSCKWVMNSETSEVPKERAAISEPDHRGAVDSSWVAPAASSAPIQQPAPPPPSINSFQ